MIYGGGHSNTDKQGPNNACAQTVNEWQRNDTNPNDRVTRKSQIRKLCTEDPILKTKFNIVKYGVWGSLILIFPFGIKFRTERCVTHYVSEKFF